MLSKISIILTGATAVFLSLSACSDFLDARRAAEREADALARGEATLAACIESQCEVLDIDGMRLADYSAINNLDHVTILMASRTNLSNLSDIQGMSQLKELHITATKITDLSGLVNFPALKVLHIERMPTGLDTTPVGQLGSLTELAIGNLGEGSDVSYIKDMRRLQRLKITWRNGFADLSILRGHPSLRIIDIYGDLPTDQSALLTMRHLETITFGRQYMLDSEIRNELERRGVFEFIPAIVVC